jgi:hypothetical protein
VDAAPEPKPEPKPKTPTKKGDLTKAVGTVDGHVAGLKSGSFDEAFTALKLDPTLTKVDLQEVYRRVANKRSKGTTRAEVLAEIKSTNG